MRFTLHHGDSAEVLKTIASDSADSIVTDPPAGIAFLSRAWDAHLSLSAFVKDIAPIFAEALRVAKPGAHALVWALPRTAHYTACALEDAGWEIVDVIVHIFGDSSVPKSRDASKAIDAEHRRIELFDVVRGHLRTWRDAEGLTGAEIDRALGLNGMAGHWFGDSQPEIPSKEQWLRLKALLRWPNCDLDDLYAEIKDGASRPVIGRSRAGVGNTTNSIHKAEGWAKSREKVFDITGAATSMAAAWNGWGTALRPASEHWYLCRKPRPGTVAESLMEHGVGAINIDGCRIDDGDRGRWPRNLLLSHSESCAARCVPSCPIGALGEAAEFFPRFGYYPKSSRRDRGGPGGLIQNDHPTVKGLALMRWLCRLVTPPGGVVLDPFAGSGSTGVAALSEGFRFLGVEREANYAETARARLEFALESTLDSAAIDAAPKQGRLF